MQKTAYTQHLFAISVSDLRTLFVAKTIYALFCHKKNLCKLFLSQTQFTRFFAKMIYALRPESFCALKVAIRKVQTLWASAALFSQKDFGTIRDIVKKVSFLEFYLSIKRYFQTGMCFCKVKIQLVSLIFSTQTFTLVKFKFFWHSSFVRITFTFCPIVHYFAIITPISAPSA